MYPQSMFLSRNKKTNVYPVYPSFTLTGSTVFKHVFLMLICLRCPQEGTFSHVVVYLSYCLCVL